MPIPCVDILPLHKSAPFSPPAVGLIYRDILQGRKGWCLVGGRMFHNESIAQCIIRQLHQTLGPHVRFSLDADPQPLYVAQYFPGPRDSGEPHCIDLRQHSLALTFAVQIEGEPVAQHEALQFQWFPINALPSPAEFGFNQDRVVAACLSKLGLF